MSTSYNSQLEQATSGIEIIDDTAGHDGKWGGIKIINDTIITGLSADGVTNLAGLEGITLVAGDYIPIRLNSITLTSGVIAAINRYN